MCNIDACAVATPAPAKPRHLQVIVEAPHLGDCDAAGRPNHARQAKICNLHVEARLVPVNGQVQQLQAYQTRTRRLSASDAHDTSTTQPAAADVAQLKALNDFTAVNAPLRPVLCMQKQVATIPQAVLHHSVLEVSAD